MNTIRRYGNVAEAGFAQSLLVAAGIDATLADEFAATLGPQFVPWGMRLQVPEKDVERALAILDGERGLEGHPDNATPDSPVPMEHEVISRDRAEIENPDITCPGCGTGWALTEEELAQPSFTCSECGTVIPHEAEVAAGRIRKFDWKAFLPRSESKWVFVLVMVAYNHALAALWMGLTDPFVPHRQTSYYTAHGWLYVMGRIADGVVVYPVLETILLAGIIEALRAVRIPAMIQVFAATLALCSVDGFGWWPHGLAVAPGFALMSFAYLYWRPASWRNAFKIVVAIHAVYNSSLYVRLVLNQVHNEIVSYQLTGNPFNQDRARTIYNAAIRLDDTGKDDEEIAELKKAISLYPYTPDYYLYLGVALRRKGDLKDAEATLRKAISLNQYYWLGWDDLSFVLYDQKRFVEAMDAAHRALATVPDDRRSEVEDMIRYIAPKMSGTSG